MDLDRHGTERLTPSVCLELLRTQRIGRLGLSVGALPVIHPVNFELDGETIVIRTESGTKLSAALRQAIVCYEVDDIDSTGSYGWSVLVTGRAEELDRDHVAVHIELISGRRRPATTAGPSSATSFLVPLPTG
jgi:nitroimidazol reductase NimA-like FMN-containing flavoprotein (pyridoxamine 5'-phosphate oxidase superfamily)